MRPPVNLGRGNVGLILRMLRTIVRGTRLGVAREVELAARLAGADLVVRVRVRLTVARPWVTGRPRRVPPRDPVDDLRAAVRTPERLRAIIAAPCFFLKRQARNFYELKPPFVF